MKRDPQRAGIVLEQDPQPGTRVEPDQQIKLVAGTGEKPVPVSQVLDLVALDPRFREVRISAEALSARAEQLQLRDRAALAAFAAAEDTRVRDDLGLPALRDAQMVKRVLRDVLATTE